MLLMQNDHPDQRCLNICLRTNPTFSMYSNCSSGGSLSGWGRFMLGGKSYFFVILWMNESNKMIRQKCVLSGLCFIFTGATVFGAKAWRNKITLENQNLRIVQRAYTLSHDSQKKSFFISTVIPLLASRVLVRPSILGSSYWKKYRKVYSFPW